MIVSCIKCNKKFEVPDNLIPKEGRLLQCGSCLHKWHFLPIITIDNEINKDLESKNNEEPSFFKKDKIIKKSDNQSLVNNEKKVKNYDPIKDKKKNLNKKDKIKFLNLLLVTIISFLALIIILDTFRNQLTKIIPKLDLYLYSLYETSTDIYLFIVNLVK
tara:strand:+ start:662 stop:1141 length:480 start_codon:yes stop_codon:yes gene_type:complete